MHRSHEDRSRSCSDLVPLLLMMSPQISDRLEGSRAGVALVHRVLHSDMDLHLISSDGLATTGTTDKPASLMHDIVINQLINRLVGRRVASRLRTWVPDATVHLTDWDALLVDLVFAWITEDAVAVVARSWDERHHVIVNSFRDTVVCFQTKTGSGQ